MFKVQKLNGKYVLWKQKSWRRQLEIIFFNMLFLCIPSIVVIYHILFVPDSLTWSDLFWEWMGEYDSLDEAISAKVEFQLPVEEYYL